MEKKLKLSCNLRFNTRNPRHVNAAKILSAVGPRYKTAFIALAVEAYQGQHPTGIDMQELSEVQRLTWGSCSKRKKCGDMNSVVIGQIDAQVQEAEESRIDIRQALDYYNI